MTRKPSRYRTILGVAIAALVAAWLPFSVMYVNAVTKHAIVTWKSGHGVVTTKSSGGQTPVSTAAASAAPHTTAVTTRAS